MTGYEKMVIQDACDDLVKLIDVLDKMYYPNKYDSEWVLNNLRSLCTDGFADRMFELMSIIKED